MINNYKHSEKCIRPWGEWEIIALNDSYIIKKIVVLPNSRISLQSHQHRNEHWIIISGVMEVTIDDKIFEVSKNSQIYIIKNQKHRITNKSQNSCVFVEVQTGDILDEKDIIRYEDDYERIAI